MGSFIKTHIIVLASALFTTSASAATLDCIQGDTTPQSIETWRLEAATALANQTVDDSEIGKKITQCFPTEVPVCLKRTLDYSGRYNIASASSDVTHDQDERKRPPSELLAPGSTGEYVIRTDIEQLAAEKGWPAVRYKSRHAGGFDSETPSLLMVYVPGDKVSPPVSYDRWLNFPLPADTEEHALTPSPQAPVPTAADYLAEANGGLSLPGTFTMVTMEKKQGTKPAEVFFQMFGRNTTGSPNFTPRGNSGVTSCYSCHPNGLRAISPLGYHVREGEAQLPEKDWNAVKLMNAAMDSITGNSAVSWRSAVVDTTTGESKMFLKPKAQGPVIGPAVPLNDIGRTEEFIMGGTRVDGTTVSGCFNRRKTVSVRDIFGRAPGANNVYTLSEQPSVRWEKVRDSMRCASCHNNVTRGALNTSTDFSQIDFKILVDQSMPLGAHQNPLDQGEAQLPVLETLTADERIALANCLREEFQLEEKKLLKWLTQASCQ